MFSDPQASAMLAVALVLVAFVRWIAARLAGRRLTKRNLFPAFSVTAFVAPAITLACGIVLFQIGSAAYLRSDGHSLISYLIENRPNGLDILILPLSSKVLAFRSRREKSLVLGRFSSSVRDHLLNVVALSTV